MQAVLSPLGDQVMALELVLEKVEPKDREFAKSLISQYARKKMLSPRQAPWVQTLLSRAMGEATVAAPAAQVGSFSAVYALFEKAREKLKFPKIRLMVNGDQVVLALSGKNSKQPNVINVTDGRPFGQNIWYGRVAADGAWTKPRVEMVNMSAVEAILKKLGEDPVQVAREYGKLTGACCFCQLPLTDPQSVAAGFGETCAKNFGLFKAYKEAKGLL